MSIAQITPPSAVPAAVADYEAQNELIQSALIGLSKITLSNYKNDLAPVIEVGSRFNVGGATYGVNTGAETPTGYSGLTVSTTFYLYFDSSAGVFIYSSTAPTWSDVYQGWYNGTDRAFFSMYKDSGGTLYEGKNRLGQSSNILTKTISLGDWDMDTTSTKLITNTDLGISSIKNVMALNVVIRNDSDGIRHLDTYNLGGPVQMRVYLNISTEEITLVRLGGGTYDTTDYNLTSYNRGWITITYKG